MEPGSSVQGKAGPPWAIIAGGIAAFALVVLAGALWADRLHDQRVAEQARIEAERLAEEERVRRAEEEARILAAEEARRTAEEFVRAATQGVQYQGTGSQGISMLISWEIEINSLTGQWTWTEEQQMGAADNTAAVAFTEDLSFTVDSTQLSHPLRIEPHEVQDGWFTVVMECHQLADCISVQGNRVVGIMQYGNLTDRQEERVSERRSSQSWVYRDRVTAERASAALADLLEHAGAPAKVY